MEHWAVFTALQDWSVANGVALKQAEHAESFTTFFHRQHLMLDAFTETLNLGTVLVFAYRVCRERGAPGAVPSLVVHPAPSPLPHCFEPGLDGWEHHKISADD